MSTPHFFSEAIWNRVSVKESYPPLNGDLETEIAVVGGGITGISAAYLLAAAGKKVVVLESDEIGMGTTGSSTGNLYAPIDERLYTIVEKHGEEELKQVVSSRLAAIEFIEQRVKELDLHCDFQRVPWHLFTTSYLKAGSDQVQKENSAAVKAGLTTRSTALADFPFSVSEITTIPEQAQFNPLAYTRQLASKIISSNCTIYEKTKVLDVEENGLCTVKTNRGTVTAQKVIMATHSPKGIYAVHTAMEPKREFALAVRIKGTLPPPGIYWQIVENSQYSIRPFRSDEGNFLLVLGRSYVVGHKEHTEKSMKKLEEYLRQYFQVESIDYTWAAQNYRPADNLPYIGSSITQSNIFIATGFAADGLVYGTLAAMILSDYILGHENEWAKLYDPQRFTPIASAKKFLKENFHVSKHLIKDYLFYDHQTDLKELKNGEGKTLSVDGEKLAAYRDESGVLHLVSSVCTHMGCIVHWNNGEKSWDCPCHGSRFTVDGEVLEGPAYANLARPKENS